MRVSPSTYDILHGNVIVSANVQPNLPPLIEKAADRCTCGESFSDDISTPYYQRYVPIAVVGECRKHGLFFAAPQQWDLDAIAYAESRRDRFPYLASEFAVVPGPKSGDLIKRGVRDYLDLFTGRQLLYLRTATELLTEMEPEARLVMALLVSTLTEFNSMLCGYKGASRRRPGAVRHVFSHHAYSFPYTALENNPLHHSRSSGTLLGLFHTRVLCGRRWALTPLERVMRNGRIEKKPITGEIDGGTEVYSLSDLKAGTRRFMLLQGSSTDLSLPDESVDHIVTDPPYFDSVQYGDLAAYFRVWLRKLLPEDAHWDYSPSDAAVDQYSNGDGQYQRVLKGIFVECSRVLKKEQGRLIFTFHHWNPKAWAALTCALKDAGFRLVNRYVIHAENPASVHIANQNAILHDVVLVLAAGDGAPKRAWACPDVVEKGNSSRFCEQCGAVLGYLLSSDVDEPGIGDLWAKLLAS